MLLWGNLKTVYLYNHALQKHMKHIYANMHDNEFVRIISGQMCLGAFVNNFSRNFITICITSFNSQCSRLDAFYFLRNRIPSIHIDYFNLHYSYGSLIVLRESVPCKITPLRKSSFPMSGCAFKFSRSLVNPCEINQLH